MEIFVHDTAFMIAYYRAQHEAVSKDPYAKLWLRPGLKKWTDEFAKHVSPHDSLLHALRNRLYYNLLSENIDDTPLLIINIGAGFSMYPYVLPENVTTLEIDFEEITNYKKAKINQFINEGALPRRDVHYFPADVTSPVKQAELSQLLTKYTEHRKIILIEGVFFFLTEGAIDQLFTYFKEILKTGDLVIPISFDSAQPKTDVYKRLLNYFEVVLKTENRDYAALPHSYYENLEGFTLNQRNSSLDLGKQMELFNPQLPESNTLNEHLYILARD